MPMVEQGGYDNRFSWHDSLKTNRSSDTSDRQASPLSTYTGRGPQESETTREVLGRSSIDARRMRPMTSSEYIRSASRLSFNLSGDDDAAPLSPTFSFDRRQCTEAQTASPDLSGDAARIGRRSLSNRPSAIALQQSRRSRLPSTLEEPGTPAKRRDTLTHQHGQSRFSTSPSSRHRKHSRSLKRRRLPDAGEPRQASREGLSFDLSKIRPRSGTVGDDEKTPKMSARINATIRGKSSLASLRKLMTRSSAAPVVPQTKVSKPPMMEDGTATAADRTQDVGAAASVDRVHKPRVREKPMPISIEVAPFEFMDAEPSCGWDDGRIMMYSPEPTPHDRQEHLDEVVNDLSRTSSAAHQEEHTFDYFAPPHAARRLETQSDKRSTILVRGSWIEIGKNASEVSWATNGGRNAKSWWSRLCGSAAARPGMAPHEADRNGGTEGSSPSSQSCRLLCATTGPAPASATGGIKQLTYVPRDTAASQAPRSSLSIKRAVTRGLSSLPSVGETMAKTRWQRLPPPPIMTRREQGSFDTAGVQVEDHPADMSSTPAPLPEQKASGVEPRRRPLSLRSTGPQPRSTVARVPTSHDNSRSGGKEAQSLPLVYLTTEGEEIEEHLTPQRTLSVLSPHRSQEEHTQRTVGSSILFLDEQLNTGTERAFRRAGAQAPSPPSSPLPTQSPSPSNKVIVTQTSPVSSKDTSVSTLEANDILFNLIRHFKNEDSPSSLGSTVATLRNDRAAASAALSPHLAHSTKRATCTTLETIMTYQSSAESDSTTESALLSMPSAIHGPEHVSSAQRSSSSLLEDLIDGIVEDIQHQQQERSRKLSPRSAPTEKRAMSHTRRRRRSSVSSLNPSVRSGAVSSKRSSSVDSAFSTFCWPPQGHPIRALVLAASPSAGARAAQHRPQRNVHGDEGGLRMLGASVVAHELEDLARHEDAWCSPLRVRTASALSALSCPRSRLRSTPSDLDLSRRDVAMVTTVSRAMMPDMNHVIRQLQAERAAKKGKRSVVSSPKIKKPGEKRRSKSLSACQTPPKIRIQRPQSDSTVSTAHGESLSDDEAIIHRASVARKSTASVFDFSAITAARVSVGTSASAQRLSRMRLDGSGKRGMHAWPLLEPSNTPDSTGTFLSDITSPVSPMSASQQWSEMSASMSASFAWSDKGKRSSFSTTYTIPSPGLAAGGSLTDHASAKRRSRKCSTGRGQQRRGASVYAPARLHDEVCRSKELFQDSDYSRSIMQAFDPPVTCKELRRLLDQSIASFVPLDGGVRLKDLRTVEIVEGRLRPRRAGQRRRRRMPRRVLADDSTLGGGSHNVTPGHAWLPVDDEAERNDNTIDSGIADDAIAPLTAADGLDESPLCMPSAMRAEDCRDMSPASYPLQSSPLAHRVMRCGDSTDDAPPRRRQRHWTDAMQSSPLDNVVWSPQSEVTMPRLSAQMLASFNVSMLYGDNEDDTLQSRKHRHRRTPQIVVQSPSTASSETRSPQWCM